MSVVKQFKITKEGHEDKFYDIGAKAENVEVDLEDEQTTTVQLALSGAAKISEELKKITTDGQVLLSKKEEGESSLKSSLVTGTDLTNIKQGIENLQVGNPLYNKNYNIDVLTWTYSSNTLTVQSNLPNLKLMVNVKGTSPQSAGGTQSVSISGITNAINFDVILGKTQASLTSSGGYKFRFGTDNFTFDYTLLNRSLGNGSQNIYYVPLPAEKPISIVNNPLIDLIYPVGSIYFSVNNLSPSYLFGGTWSKIEGRFLLGSGLNLSHLSNTTLVSSQLGGYYDITGVPNHTHNVSGYTSTDGNHSHSMGTIWSQGAGGNSAYTYSGSRKLMSRTTADAGSHYHSININSGGVIENLSPTGKNMPPYFVVNIWKRTA